jgi:hypothetical protein
MPISVLMRILIMFDININDSQYRIFTLYKNKNTSIIHVKNVILYTLNEACTTFLGRRPQPLFWVVTWSVRVKIIITGLYKLLNKLLCKFL